MAKKVIAEADDYQLVEGDQPGEIGLMWRMDYGITIPKSTFLEFAKKLEEDEGRKDKSKRVS